MCYGCVPIIYLGFVLRLRIESFTFQLDYLVFGISHIKAIRPKAKVICEMCRDELRVCYLKIHGKVSTSLKQLILLYWTYYNIALPSAIGEVEHSNTPSSSKPYEQIYFVWPTYC